MSSPGVAIKESIWQQYHRRYEKYEIGAHHKQFSRETSDVGCQDKDDRRFKDFLKSLFHCFWKAISISTEYEKL